MIKVAALRNPVERSSHGHETPSTGKKQAYNVHMTYSLQAVIAFRVAIVIYYWVLYKYVHTPSKYMYEYNMYIGKHLS